MKKDTWILIGIALILIFGTIQYFSTLNGKPFDYIELTASLKYYIIVIAVFVLGFAWAYDKFKK